MRDYINIGSTPPEEDCAQVGSDDYRTRALAECRRYIDVIRAKLGPEVGSAVLSVKSFPHDFGTYYEVVCFYDDDDALGQDYAFKCESDGPMTWTDVAREGA